MVLFMSSFILCVLKTTILVYFLNTIFSYKVLNAILLLSKGLRLVRSASPNKPIKPLLKLNFVSLLINDATVMVSGHDSQQSHPFAFYHLS